VINTFVSITAFVLVRVEGIEPPQVLPTSS
jgi:hypothetical protein